MDLSPPSSPAANVLLGHVSRERRQMMSAPAASRNTVPPGAEALRRSGPRSGPPRRLCRPATPLMSCHELAQAPRGVPEAVDARPHPVEQGQVEVADGRLRLDPDVASGVDRPAASPREKDG